MMSMMFLCLNFRLIILMCSTRLMGEIFTVIYAYNLLKKQTKAKHENFWQKRDQHSNQYLWCTITSDMFNSHFLLGLLVQIDFCKIIFHFTLAIDSSKTLDIWLVTNCQKLYTKPKHRNSQSYFVRIFNSFVSMW